MAVIIAPVCLVMAWRQGNRKRNPPSCPCGAGAAFDGAVKDRAFVKAQMSASNPELRGGAQMSDVVKQEEQDHA